MAKDIKKTKPKVYRMDINPLDEESGVFAISMVSAPAIQEGWIALSKQHKVELKVTNDVQRIVTGPVLLTDQKILRIDEATGEEYYITFPKETIAKAAELFLKRQNNLAITLEHQKDIQGSAYIMESWVSVDSKKDKSYALLGQEYPIGSWFVSAKVNDNELYQQGVKNGTLTGWSLEGLFNETLIEASAVEPKEEDIELEGSNLDSEDLKVEELKVILEQYLSSLK